MTVAVRYVLTVDGARRYCGRGEPHPLGPVGLRAGIGNGGRVTLVAFCRCVGCGRIYLTPVVRLPERFLVSQRNEVFYAKMRNAVHEWAHRWIAHEAGRP